MLSIFSWPDVIKLTFCYNVAPFQKGFDLIIEFVIFFKMW